MTQGHATLALGDLTPVAKQPTGIEGFDHITLGGLPSGRTTPSS